MSIDLQKIINASTDIKDDFKNPQVNEALDMLVRHFKEIGENQINITWCVDDIRFLGYECTDEEGMKVLELVEEDHDCEYGINWATLDNACESFNLKVKSDDNIHKVNDDFIRKEADDVS